MTTLSTHVLDTASGRPAVGMTIRLVKDETIMFEGITDTGGRCPAMNRELPVGTYRLVFGVADYFRSQGVALPDPPFIDRVGIDFGLSEPDGHYHVPLLVSPFAYSTYRGS